MKNIYLMLSAILLLGPVTSAELKTKTVVITDLSVEHATICTEVFSEQLCKMLQGAKNPSLQVRCLPKRVETSAEAQKLLRQEKGDLIIWGAAIPMRDSIQAELYIDGPSERIAAKDQMGDPLQAADQVARFVTALVSQ